MSMMGEDQIYKLPNDVESELQKIMEEHGYENCPVQISAACPKGNNFMGFLYRMSAIRNAKRFSLVCKCEPESLVRREEFRTGIVFEREEFVYKNVFNIFDEFQKEKGVPMKHRFIHPEYLGSGDGYLFLSDLREEGYKMFDRLKDVDFNHVKKAVESLAKFHAIGFALKHQRPKEFKICQGLSDVYYAKSQHEGLYTYFRMMIDRASNSLRNDEKNLKEKLQNLKNDLPQILPNLVDSKDAEPYAIFTHGDFWNNNALYKYEDGKPVSVCLLDYQMSRYGSPALDLSYFIFCSTDQKFRDLYYDDVLQAYHRSLSDYLRVLGNDASFIFPYEELEDQMKRFGVFGLIMAIVIVHVNVSESDEIHDLDELAEKFKKDEDFSKLVECKSQKSDRLYNKRISDLLRHADRMGML